ncbi:hypothetical protein BD779DRAFT_1786383 [Infundibulicybe gibba]|nr:hypothetical protein BD779DRAFT_1786383 [Infundibulicybe gibba]
MGRLFLIVWVWVPDRAGRLPELACMVIEVMYCLNINVRFNLGTTRPRAIFACKAFRLSIREVGTVGGWYPVDPQNSSIQSDWKAFTISPPKSASRPSGANATSDCPASTETVSPGAVRRTTCSGEVVDICKRVVNVVLDQ